MFKLQNIKTGKFAKDAVSNKAMSFRTADEAKAFGDSLHRDFVLSATAWNSKRGFAYRVVKG